LPHAPQKRHKNLAYNANSPVAADVRRRKLQQNQPPYVGGYGLIFEVIDIFLSVPRLPSGMTTANKITILRILLIPFFVVEVLYYVKNGNEAHRLAAILSFAVAAICDGVDGYIARRYNQRSELGAILDPLADKLLLVSGIVVLSFEHRPHLETIPLWLTGTIIGRDILVLAGMVVIQMTVGKVSVRPRMIGKVATVLQMVIILWILLKWDPKWLRVWLLAAAFCTGISGLLYVWDGSRQLSAHPASSPKTET
jgi:cardiolipin synthase (CMP-forming)